MRKIAILLIALLVISVGFLSGCNEQISTENQTGDSDIIENQPPTCTASANITSGYTPLSISFIGSGIDSDGSIISYHWDFGDGESSNEQNPIHIYYGIRTYTVRLTVSDNDGETDSSTMQITVMEELNNPPTASASADVTSGMSPLTAHFTGSGIDSDGTIVSYHWDFGDDTTSSQQNPTKSYNSQGTYTAILTVTDNEGATDSDTIIITVTEPLYDDDELFSWITDVVDTTLTYNGYAGSSYSSISYWSGELYDKSIEWLEEVDDFYLSYEYDRIRDEFREMLKDLKWQFFYRKEWADTMLLGYYTLASDYLELYNEYAAKANAHMNMVTEMTKDIIG